MHKDIRKHVKASNRNNRNCCLFALYDKGIKVQPKLMDKDDDLRRLGVHAHSASGLESAFEAQAEHAILAHDTAQRKTRLDRVQQIIRDLDERISKSKSSTRLDKLLNRLEEVQEEERALLKAMEHEEKSVAPKVVEVAKESTQGMPFLVSLPSKRTTEPLVTTRTDKQERDVSDREYEEPEDEGESSESTESEEDYVEDDANDSVYKARIKDWSLRNGLPHEYFLGGLRSQCIDAEQTFHNFDLVPIVKDKYYLQSQLWNQEMLPYQREGTRWLLLHHSKGEGGVLADEMGLGKTAQTIMMLAALHISGKFDKPVLVVTPTTIMRQWVREVRRWWSPLRVVILHSSGHLGREALTVARVRSALREVSERGHVLVTSYGTLRAFSKILLSTRWLITVLDEGHRIRNPEADITKVCKELKGDSRFILSGTPIQNNLIELWSLLDFVCAGRLGTLPVFKAEFVAPISAGGYVHATHFQVQLAYQCACTLKELIEPFLLRRIKADVAQQLPPKEEQILFCQLTAEQRQLYEDCLNSEDIQSILEGERNVLAGIDLLRKICNHTALLKKERFDSFSVDEHCSKSGKLAVVKALLGMWREEGHRALLFCQTRQMLDIVEAFVRMLQLGYLRMDGTTSVRQRSMLVDQFNADDSIPLFLLTTKVGGLGVNLTGADRVIIYDPDWNPSTDLQARERVWRLGQNRPVSIYRLVMSGTIEEKIYHRQIFKQFLTNRILRDPKQARFFKATDLYDLFTLGDSKQTETAEMFSGLEQEIALKMGRGVHTEPDESVKRDHEELVPDRSHILDALFHAVDGLHSAIRHDLIVERPSRERLLVQHEVSKLARDAADALKQSHQLPHLDPNSLSERLFRTFRANDDTLTSAQLVTHFSREVNATNSSTLFKALLKSIATFDHKAKRWQLGHEFARL